MKKIMIEIKKSYYIKIYTYNLMRNNILHNFTQPSYSHFKKNSKSCMQFPCIETKDVEDYPQVNIHANL